jgi:hypothetical protein
MSNKEKEIICDECKHIMMNPLLKKLEKLGCKDLARKVQEIIGKLNETEGCGQKNLIQEIPVKTLEWGKVCEEELTWGEAKEWCENQGKDWRLPTRIELLQAFEEKIDGFGVSNCWSSTEYSSMYVWHVSFINGYSYFYYKSNVLSVRAVRTIK